MGAALKILILPSLFILPWLLMKLSDGESFIRETVTQNPGLLVAALLPGLILSVGWILKQLRR